MEERIIDKDDPKIIRLKRTEEGETDAVDPLAEDDGERIEEELVFDASREEYDEDLVGLTPSQLEKELERRRKAEEEARAECGRLVEEAEEALAGGDYLKAESCFSQATCYSFADERILKGLWIARTKDFTDYEPFYVSAHAEEFSAMDKEAKEFVRERVGEKLSAEREEMRKAEEEIAPPIEKRQEERRAAFRENRRYYLVRIFVLLVCLAAAIVGAAVSAYYIVRTTGIAPVVLTAAFGAIAFGLLCGLLYLLRQFIIADRLCRANEDLASTDEGARLKSLRERIYCLNLVLDDPQEEE